MSAIDKQHWSDGPWKTEPDRVEFEHAGLPCLMLRNDMGAWCGYAAVPPGHPLHGHDYRIPDVRAHRGLNYAAACSGEICHVAKPGEPDPLAFRLSRGTFYFGQLGTSHFGATSKMAAGVGPK